MALISATQWLGQQNDDLVDVGQHHKLHPKVLPDFIAMQHAALADGIDLQLVSSYRDFYRQAIIFNKKWRGETKLLDVNGDVVNPKTLNDEQKLNVILTWSALPGGSRHHWGTDIDVYDKSAVARWQGEFNLVEQEYAPNGPCYNLARWLDKHMQKYGFYRPFEVNKGGVAREPWHLSHHSTAAQFENARNLEELKMAIESSDIQGKSCIINRLPLLYDRYVLNNGIKHE